MLIVTIIIIIITVLRKRITQRLQYVQRCLTINNVNEIQFVRIDKDQSSNTIDNLQNCSYQKVI